MDEDVLFVLIEDYVDSMSEFVFVLRWVLFIKKVLMVCVYL